MKYVSIYIYIISVFQSFIYFNFPSNGFKNSVLQYFSPDETSESRKNLKPRSCNWRFSLPNMASISPFSVLHWPLKINIHEFNCTSATSIMPSIKTAHNCPYGTLTQSHIFTTPRGDRTGGGVHPLSSLPVFQLPPCTRLLSGVFYKAPYANVTVFEMHKPEKYGVETPDV